MAKMFYTLAETIEKFGLTGHDSAEQVVKQLTYDSHLRQFMDGPNPMFMINQVESLMWEAEALATVKRVIPEYSGFVGSVAPLNLEPPLHSQPPALPEELSAPPHFNDVPLDEIHAGTTEPPMSFLDEIHPHEAPLISDPLHIEPAVPHTPTPPATPHMPPAAETNSGILRRIGNLFTEGKWLGKKGLAWAAAATVGVGAIAYVGTRGLNKDPSAEKSR